MVRALWWVRHDLLWMACYGTMVGLTLASFIHSTHIYRSEYQRQTAGGHASALTAETFNRSRFDARVPRLAMRYALMLKDVRAISARVQDENVFVLRCVVVVDPTPILL